MLSKDLPTDSYKLLSFSHSDKVGERFYHITASFVVGILGFVIAISTMNTAARYVSLCVFSGAPRIPVR
jgi:hypothetical protein